MKLSTILLSAVLAASPTAALPQHDAPAIVSAEWLEAHIDDPTVLVVQVGMAHRPPNRWIAGAVDLDYHAITRDVGDLVVELPPVEDVERSLRQVGISSATHVVLYGAPGHLPARAWMTLDWLGHERKSLLDGGLEGWVEDGRPVANTPASAAPGDFVARVRDDVLVDSQWIQKHLSDPLIQLVDARPIVEFTGERRNGARPGHIPGASNLYWEELLDPGRQPRLLDMASVRARLEQAGATPGKTVVSYCFIGMRASFNYVIARHLGYDVRFYDGSWNDWSQRAELPTATGPARQ